MMEDAIQFLELHERVSKKGTGRRYFTGSLNGCRVVIIQNENVIADEGVEAVWSMFIQPGRISRWQHTEKGRANAEGRLSKARQRNIDAVKRTADEN
jgi:hypothetical protein